jgi:hypothetical protein
LLEPCPLRGRGCPQISTQDEENKNVNNPQKERERENIGYMSDVVLLKRYLRSSTGSQ